MAARTNQISEDTIRRLVDRFYARIRADPVLGPIFMRAIPGEWSAHLAVMCDFWSSVMLTSGRYKGSPATVHLRIEGIEPQMFDRWLEIFDETCDALFEANESEAFRAKAARIAESLKLSLFYRPDEVWPRRAT
ncbi:group III truncated hemoglobin (plasmid) [Phyllobacterium sp. A18/5-2]|uniref:group III truncated hemoglobin n=1 Tax=Phyllobacterium sp. A18/5-2 TaxID=2978392 RepID=UPI0021C8605D|nr:group III truncated hemoglobin [Phyllobacterium sp. A18/5-2]UXN66112.1 group III truncated hemoglobin [Phyllobacterium sp. A18/5-2]